MGSSGSKRPNLIKSRSKESPHKIDTYEYEWTTANFRDAITIGKCTTTEKLLIDVDGTSDEWEVVLYPGGFNERTSDFISVFLRRISTVERLVKFTCEIQRSNTSVKKELVRKTIKKKLSLETAIGWVAFCKRSHILDEGLQDGSLVLKCTLEVYDDKYIVHSAIEDEDPYMEETLSELSRNLGALFDSKKDFDVTFKVSGELFHAHRVILAARSSVFRAMFEMESEIVSKSVDITDIGKEAFRAMLTFLYNGTCYEIDWETALELYYAADKYELFSLRRICSNILAQDLSPENACKVIATAHKHIDMALLDISIRFIAKNASVILKKGEWLKLMKSFPSVANSVFECLSQFKDSGN